jgi:serine/threonine protein kinase
MSTELVAGTVVLDRYRVEKTLGSGAMGAVYLGRHVRLGTQVAIKVVLTTDDEARDRFTREAELMARVRSPHVVTILDIGITPTGSPCLAMEYVDGQTLDRLMGRGPMAAPEAVDIAVAILTGLAAVHGAGVIHRDLKPANVMLTHDQPRLVKVVDFGIARSANAQEARITRTGLVAGTPAYMAPEHLMDLTVDGRTDVYSVALMLYECITGSLPFAGEASPMAQVMRRLQQDVPPLTRVPPAMATVVATMLAREPNQRPANATIAAAQLTAAIRPAPLQAPSPVVLQTQMWGVTKPPPSSPSTSSAANPGSRAWAGSTHAWSPAGPARPTIAPEDLIATPDGRTQMSVSPPSASSLSTQVPIDWLPNATMLLTVEADAPTKWAVAALLPAQRLALVAERQWLAAMVQPGRGFRTGDALWFAVTTSAKLTDVAAQAEQLVAAIVQRFGPTSRAAWVQLPEDFEMTAASASGASALPPMIAQLMERVLRPPQI